MKILIAIPSKNRVETLRKFALQWVQHAGFDWQVFVEPQDLEAYGKEIIASHLYCMPQNNQGLGYAKGCIKEYAKTFGYTHIFKIDDDVRGFTNFRRKLNAQETADWFKVFIKDIEKCFDKYDAVKAVGFPYGFEMWEKVQWEVVKRLQTAYIVRTEAFYVNSAISVFEDFAAGLSIIANNGIVMKYGNAGIDMGVKVGAGTGGHQSFDREKQAMSELDELRKIYPPLNYRRVAKPWKIEPDLSSVHYPHKK